jgi:DnaJ-class molecular chaperone
MTLTEQTTELLPELESKCSACEGEGGKIENGKYTSICKRCDGEGVVVTERGRKLLSFLNRRLPRVTEE